MTMSKYSSFYVLCAISFENDFRATDKVMVPLLLSDLLSTDQFILDPLRRLQSLVAKTLFYPLLQYCRSSKVMNVDDLRVGRME